MLSSFFVITISVHHHHHQFTLTITITAFLRYNHLILYELIAVAPLALRFVPGIQSYLVQPRHCCQPYELCIRLSLLPIIDPHPGTPRNRRTLAHAYGVLDDIAERIAILTHREFYNKWLKAYGRIIRVNKVSLYSLLHRPRSMIGSPWYIL